MENIQCIVEKIIYQDSESGFYIIKCQNDEYSDLITVLGNLQGISVGSTIYAEGRWENDIRYGKQFRAEKWHEEMPNTLNGIMKYLSSGFIKGIGKKYAKRIVQKFGENTLDIIDNYPQRLKEVEGLGSKRIELIVESWKEQKEIRNIMISLQELDISSLFAIKIYEAYGDECIDIIRNNPYKLVDDIQGIGFKKADAIASKVGIAKDSYIRLQSGISYSLKSLSEDGHCFAYKDQLLCEAESILNVDKSGIEITVDDMINSSAIINDGDALYLRSFYFSELGCAKKLMSIAHSKKKAEIDIEKIISQLKKESDIEYDKMQIAAIKKSLLCNLLVITGGPGTGKTTITCGIIKVFSKLKYKIKLAAPTGRAAKRMTEATGIGAKTIHRLLEYQPGYGFNRNESFPIDADVLILDECSMIDIMLMYSLLRALPDQIILILIGDIDQLPSVGPGNVLKDIVESNVVPVVRLEKIFRQAQDSRIITNSHLINEGKMPILQGGKDSDFFFATQTSNEDIVNTIVQFCTKNLPNYYHVDPFKDIQVLTPMQHGICGTINLNQLLQEALNPSDKFLKHGDTIFRVNDKVMQTSNDYEKDVFNGDMGIVSSIDTEEEMLNVNFDGRIVCYDNTDVDELVLSYAITIHKSQGSEYPIVVIPITLSHSIMLQRNLIYTAVTRAKKILVLVGDKKALEYAVNNLTTTKRNTKLKQRLYELKAQSAENKINSQKSISFNADDLFNRLSKSKFRSGFHLNDKDKEYINDKGIDTIRSHARDFIKKRLSPSEIPNDGKQTPMKGHPVFIAQHATATCCRGCLEKWHSIPKGRDLTDEEQEYIVSIIMEWINRQMK